MDIYKTGWQVLPAVPAPRRSYRITVGLEPGYPTPYGDGETKLPASWYRDFAPDLILDWMRGRAEAGEPFLTGVVSYGDVLYAWRGGHHSEPVLVFSGEVSVIYAADLPDIKVKVMLNELARKLGEALCQHRVYVSYRDESWALEDTQDGVTSPRDTSDHGTSGGVPLTDGLVERLSDEAAQAVYLPDDPDDVKLLRIWQALDRAEVPDEGRTIESRVDQLVHMLQLAESQKAELGRRLEAAEGERDALAELLRKVGDARPEASK